MGLSCMAENLTNLNLWKLSVSLSLSLSLSPLSNRRVDTLPNPAVADHHVPSRHAPLGLPHTAPRDIRSYIHRVLDRITISYCTYSSVTSISRSICTRRRSFAVIDMLYFICHCSRMPRSSVLKVSFRRAQRLTLWSLCICPFTY
jgi:hypothetical protein